jgi:pyruvate dehydrogenase E1 component alpha subunit
MGDIGFGRGYRTKEELDNRWKHEPVGRFRHWLLAEKVCTEEALSTIDAAIETEMLEAVTFAQESPHPELEEVSHHVYA